MECSTRSKKKNVFDQNFGFFKKTSFFAEFCFEAIYREIYVATFGRTQFGNIPKISSLLVFFRIFLESLEI